MEKSPKPKISPEEKLSTNLEIPANEKKSAEAARWLSKGWNKLVEEVEKSKILGGGKISKKAVILGAAVMMAMPGMGQQKESSKQADQEIANQTQKSLYYDSPGEHKIRRKLTKEEAEKNYRIQFEAKQDSLKKVSDSENKKTKHVTIIRGSGDTFYAEIPTKEGIKYFEGAEDEKEYKKWRKNAEESAEEMENAGSKMRGLVVSGSGDTFMAEVPFTDEDGNQGTRLFRGAEDEKLFNAWKKKAENAGAKFGTYEEMDFSQSEPGEYEEVSNIKTTKTQKSSPQKNKNYSPKNKSNDDDFYMKVNTTRGPREFKGAKGKKEYQRFIANSNRNRNNMNNMNNMRNMRRY